MTKVTSTAEIRTDGEQLTADRDLTDWIQSIPAHAVLAPIEIEKGSQRDPWPVLVGLRATWEEDR